MRTTAFVGKYFAFCSTESAFSKVQKTYPAVNYLRVPCLVLTKNNHYEKQNDRSGGLPDPLAG